MSEIEMNEILSAYDESEDIKNGIGDHYNVFVLTPGVFLAW